MRLRVAQRVVTLADFVLFFLIGDATASCSSSGAMIYRLQNGAVLHWDRRGQTGNRGTTTQDKSHCNGADSDFRGRLPIQLETHKDDRLPVFATTTLCRELGMQAKRLSNLPRLIQWSGQRADCQTISAESADRSITHVEHRPGPTT